MISGLLISGLKGSYQKLYIEKLVRKMDAFLNIRSSRLIFSLNRGYIRDYCHIKDEIERIDFHSLFRHEHQFEKLLDTLGERKCEKIYKEMRDKGVNDNDRQNCFTDRIDKGVDVAYNIRKFIALYSTDAEYIISRYLTEINEDEIFKEFGKEINEREFCGKCSTEQSNFFAKYFYFCTGGGHPPFDYVAFTKDNEVCIIEVKSTTMERQSPNFSDKEKEAIKEAKNVGISVIVATVNYEPSWNLRVKLIKL